MDPRSGVLSRWGNHIPPSPPPRRGYPSRPSTQEREARARELLFEGGGTHSPAPSSPQEGMTGGMAVSDPQDRSENPPGANTAPLLFLQKTPRIYSVELNAATDMKQTEEEGGKEKYRGLQDNGLEPRKNHHKEDLTKEIVLVSGLGPEVKGTH